MEATTFFICFSGWCTSLQLCGFEQYNVNLCGFGPWKNTFLHCFLASLSFAGFYSYLLYLEGGVGY